MANDSVFHPYTIISQSANSLQLQADNRGKLMRIIFLVSPLILVGTGITLYVIQKQLLFLFVMCGVALLEYLLFSFIKIPGNVQMDTMGFTLQTTSVTGTKQNDYLWSDVDYIRQRITQPKGNVILNYHAVLESGKKVGFLSFSNYREKTQSAEQINFILQTISKKVIK